MPFNTLNTIPIYTTNATTTAATNWHIEPATTNFHIDKFVKESDIQQIVEDLTRKIYNVLYNLDKIDIGEDEFIKLIKEG